MSDHVILLHGLWMRAFTLVALRHQLQRAGHAVEVFDYASVLRGPEVSVHGLLQRVHALKSANVHLVGHSLGGLIALQALQREPELTRGRVVCLGSPLRGSAVARGVARLPGGALIVGKNLEILRAGIEHWRRAPAGWCDRRASAAGLRLRRRRPVVAARRHGQRCRDGTAGPD